MSTKNALLPHLLAQQEEELLKNVEDGLSGVSQDLENYARKDISNTFEADQSFPQVNISGLTIERDENDSLRTSAVQLKIDDFTLERIAADELKLNGNTKIAGDLLLSTVENPDYSAKIYYNSNGNLDIEPRIGYHTIFKGGNVGIGIDQPGDLLNVHDGNIQISNSEETALALKFTDSQAPTTQFAKLEYNSGDNNLHLVNNYGGTERGLVINKDGKVGIGVTNPSEKLNIKGGNLRIEDTGNIYLGIGVRGENRAELALLSNSENTPSEVQFGFGNKGNDNNIRWAFSDRGKAEGKFRLYRAPGLNGTWQYATTWLSDGKVGINQDNPSQTLDVGGNILTSGAYYISDSNTKIGEGNGNSVKITTNSGYIELGAQNTSWAHLNTDRPAFYLNKKVAINGNLSSYTGDFILERDDVEKLRLTTLGAKITGDSSFTGNLTNVGTSADGFAGEGWGIVNNGDDTYSAYVDNLTVRKAMQVYELNINKIRSGNGSYWFSDGSKIVHVILNNGSSHTTYYEKESGGCPFVSGDIIRCQVWTGTGIKYYEGKVTAVGDSGTFSDWQYANIEIASMDGSDVPEIGDEVVKVDSTITDRRGAVYITSNDSNSPYISVVEGNGSVGGAFNNHVRIGKLNGITSGNFGALNGYGFWASGNAYLEGKIVSTEGNIGGWDITNSNINKNNVFISPAFKNTTAWNGTSNEMPTIALFKHHSGVGDRVYVHMGETYAGTFTNRFGFSLTPAKSDPAYFEFSRSMDNGALTAQIAGWNFDDSTISKSFSGNKLSMGLSTAYGSGYSSFEAYKDSSNHIALMAHNTVGNVYLIGKTGGVERFRLSNAANHIAGWNFDNSKLYKGNFEINSATEELKLGSSASGTSSSGIYLKSDGTFNFAVGANDYIRKSGSDLLIKSTNFALSTNGSIGLGASSYSLGNGVWLSSTAGQRFRVGNAGGSRMQWTNTNLEFYNSSNEKLVTIGSTNKIAGFSIESRKLMTTYWDRSSLGPPGTPVTNGEYYICSNQLEGSTNSNDNILGIGLKLYLSNSGFDYYTHFKIGMLHNFNSVGYSEQSGIEIFHDSEPFVSRYSHSLYFTSSKRYLRDLELGNGLNVLSGDINIETTNIKVENDDFTITSAKDISLISADDIEITAPDNIILNPGNGQGESVIINNLRTGNYYVPTNGLYMQEIGGHTVICINKP